MKEKLMRFMQGRYGVDSFNKFLLVIAFIGMVVSTFTKIQLFYWISIFAIVYAYFRMLSRNYQKRFSENQIYMKYFDKIRNLFKKGKSPFSFNKTHHIYRCPKCKQKIRVPKGRGKIAIRCQKCGTEFYKRS